MANFTESYNKLQGAEFSSNPAKFLHENETEEGLTIGGVYEKANQHNISWDLVYSILDACENDMERASKMLFTDEEIQIEIVSAFKYGYWNVSKLEDVNSQLIANKIFMSNVNLGVSTSVKIAQEVIGTKADGIIGVKTLKALNAFDEKLFNQQFTIKLKNHYQTIVKLNPKKNIFLAGWMQRADLC